MVYRQDLNVKVLNVGDMTNCEVLALKVANFGKGINILIVY